MGRSKTSTLLVVIALMAQGVAESVEVPQDLRTVPVANALGLDLYDVAFEWTSSNDDAEASSFQILVADRRNDLGSNERTFKLLVLRHIAESQIANIRKAYICITIA